MNAGIILDRTSECLWQGEKQVHLPPKAYALLVYMVDNRERILTQGELLDAVWPQVHIQPEVVKTYIRSLRRAFDDIAPGVEFIQTRVRRGYRFVGSLRERTGATGMEPAMATTLPHQGRDVIEEAYTCASGGNARAIFVTGEMGTGKTCLLDRLERRSRTAADVTVLRGTAGPVRDGERGHVLLDVLAEAFPELGTQAWWQRPDPEAGTGLPELGLMGVLSLLRRYTRDRLLILLLDDMQWADAASISMLSAILRDHRMGRLLVMVASRDHARDSNGLLRLRADLLSHRKASEIGLVRWTAEDVGRLVQSRFGPELSGRLERLVAFYSGRNPLFASLIVDHLSKSERLLLDEVADYWPDRFRISEPMLAAILPPALEDMLALELDALDPKLRRIVEVATVCGRTFCSWSVSSLTDRDPIEADLCCMELVAAGLCQKKGVAQMPDGVLTTVFGFKHTLYWDILQKRMSPLLRQHSHLRLALRVEALWGKNSPELARSLMLHFQEGLDGLRAAKYSQLMNAAAASTPRPYVPGSASGLESITSAYRRINRSSGWEERASA